MKDEGTRSKAPISEAFGQWPNVQIVLIALFGAVAGQAVVWYAGQFYALFFLERVLKVDAAAANIMIAIALVLATPFFVVFGWLSDRIGRKPIIMAGLLLAAVDLFPFVQGADRRRQPGPGRGAGGRPRDGRRRPRRLRVSVRSDRQAQVRPDRLRRRQVVPGAGPAFPMPTPRGAREPTLVRIGAVTDPVDDSLRAEGQVGARRGRLSGQGGAGPGQPAAGGRPPFLLVLYVTMVYGPIAALLVELFPTRIRYTSMSLPYHIGNGWFGGFLPPPPSRSSPRAAHLRRPVVSSDRRRRSPRRGTAVASRNARAETWIKRSASSSRISTKRVSQALV